MRRIRCFLNTALYRRVCFSAKEICRFASDVPQGTLNRGRRRSVLRKYGGRARQFRGPGRQDPWFRRGDGFPRRKLRNEACDSARERKGKNSLMIYGRFGKTKVQRTGVLARKALQKYSRKERASMHPPSMEDTREIIRRCLGKICSAEGRQVGNERPNVREDAVWYSVALRAVPGRSGFCIGRCGTPLLNSSGNLRCRPGQCKTPASPVHSYQRCRCFPGTAFPQAAPRSREDLFWLFVCRFHHASEANGGLHGETGWNILRTFSLRPLRQR